ncbi:MAG TPA: ATP-binding protein [Anaerolineales bacterium]|nr:ATP-binding protein [Anaerolineales bacterium]
MSRTNFVGRGRELAVLDDEWGDASARMLIVYGRRRVGKTRLITHWIKNNGKRALYWVAEPTSSADQLRSFSQALFGFESPSPVPENFSYGNWGQAFEQAARIAQNDRFALVLDEFTYLMTLEEGIAGVLQNAWDHHLKKSNIFLIISGSHLGMMERGVLSYQAPLYGRATSRLHLQPLPFKTTHEMFPKYSAAERVALYAVFGGVPAYWEQFDQKISLDKNITQNLLSDGNLYQDESRLLLQDFVTDIHNYAGILRAIAHGYRTPKEIATSSGLNDRHISMYLSNLAETGFVARRVPITARPSSRKGRHHITDPFLRFYFRFLSQRQAQLALGVQDQALAEIKKQLPVFIGRHTWEELSREWLIRASGKNILPFLPDQIGSIWNRDAQIDVAGINTMEKTLFLGECKWNRQKIGVAVLKRLVAKTELVLPKNGSWRVFYLGFSRSGWAESAIQFAEKEVGKSQGKRWECAGILLRRLDQIDGELQAWTIG